MRPGLTAVAGLHTCMRPDAGVGCLRRSPVAASRVGSDGCVLGLPETRLAIIPGAGGTQRLPHLIGVPKAKDLIYTGRTLKAYEAYEFGCLDRYVVQGGALEEVSRRGAQLRGGPRRAPWDHESEPEEVRRGGS